MIRSIELERLLARVGETHSFALECQPGVVAFDCNAHIGIAYYMGETTRIMAERATKIISGRSSELREYDRYWLARPVLEDDVYWTDDYEQLVDLSPAPGLLAHARLLDRLRRASLARLES
ncbi:MAG TPA: hypothetical protein VI072_36370 [Polyangiaceae bacterium]